MIIIVDGREKKKWDFSFYNCEQVTQPLAAGDYIVMKNDRPFVAIERKATSSELYANLCKNYVRFRKELIKLQEIPHAYIVCEFTKESLLKFPWNTKLPRRFKLTARLNGKAMLDRLEHIEDKYKVKTIFALNRADALDKVVKIFCELTNERQN